MLLLHLIVYMSLFLKYGALPILLVLLWFSSSAFSMIWMMLLFGVGSGPDRLIFGFDPFELIQIASFATMITATAILHLATGRRLRVLVAR